MNAVTAYNTVARAIQLARAASGFSPSLITILPLKDWNIFFRHAGIDKKAESHIGIISEHHFGHSIEHCCRIGRVVAIDRQLHRSDRSKLPEYER